MNTALTILPAAAGQRADKFMVSILPEFSRSFWQKQLEKGAVKLNGVALKVAGSIREGSLEVDIATRVVESLDLPILYQDEDVIVVNKPAGVLTHAKGGVNTEATVADFIRPYAHKDLADLDPDRAGIVHRLDRDTSGVLIAAKSPKAAEWLQDQFAERQAKKTYTALVEGRLEPSAALLKLPIDRNPKAPQSFRVNAGGKSAETSYTVQEYLPKTTLVELHPHTGRTHQLRVHMAYVNHPIIGDRLYGASVNELNGRLFLHAAELEITLPNGEMRTFTAPLPPELQSYLQKQRA
jgi:23S rRNA pseudouridine1911/1915/1917 synthase